MTAIDPLVSCSGLSKEKGRHFNFPLLINFIDDFALIHWNLRESGLEKEERHTTMKAKAKTVW